MIEIATSRPQRDAYARAHAARGQALRRFVNKLSLIYSAPLRSRFQTGALTGLSR